LRLLGLPCACAPRLSSLFHVDHAALQAAGRARWATRAGANENAGSLAKFVPPHLWDRHAQTTRQERQKKAAAWGGFKCVRRMFLW